MILDPVWKLSFRDINNAYIGQASPGEYDGIDLMQHWNDVSVAQVKIAQSAAIYPNLQNVYGIALTRNGVTMLSGPIEKPDFKYDANRSPAQIEAYDYIRVLQDRLTYPSTATNGSSAGLYTFSAPNDAVSAMASEDAIYHYVKNNLSSLANGDDGVRRMSVLTFGTSLSRGALIKDSLRFKYLLKALQDITYFEPSLGFQIVETGVNNQLRFDVVTNRDLTASVVFSKSMGNLIDVDYDRERPKCNAVVVLASGTGTSRTVFIKTDATSIARYGRIEQVITASNVSDAGNLETQAAIYLAQNAMIYAIKLHVNDQGSTMTQYGADYKLGDKVTLIDPETGTLVQEYLRSIHFTVDANGAEKIEPIIATPAKKHRTRSKNGILDITANINSLQGQT